MSYFVDLVVDMSQYISIVRQLATCNIVKCMQCLFWDRDKNSKI